MQTFAKIRGTLQHYAWGGQHFLPKLFGVTPEQHKRYAEYWLGIHPKGAATLVDGVGADGAAQPLTQWLEDRGQRSLPFLFKVLDVASMLSIQVHPNRTQAIDGYQREERLGIPLTAEHRNFKDTNHKPELMFALTDFWLLHGLSDPQTLAQRLRARDYLAPLADILEAQGLSAAFLKTLDDQDAELARMQRSLRAELDKLSTVNKNSHDFWAKRWLAAHPATDKGLLTLYLMNIVNLKEGEVIYQPAGLLHAYLEGRNIEVMANSDNVLRAGLTPKHVDVAELAQIASFSASDPKHYLVPKRALSSSEWAFPTPCPEFELGEVYLDRELTRNLGHLELVWCYQGSLQLEEQGRELRLEAGEAAVVAPGFNGRWRALTGPVRTFVTRAGEDTATDA